MFISNRFFVDNSIDKSSKNKDVEIELSINSAFKIWQLSDCPRNLKKIKETYYLKYTTVWCYKIVKSVHKLYIIATIIIFVILDGATYTKFIVICNLPFARYVW